MNISCPSLFDSHVKRLGCNQEPTQDVRTYICNFALASVMNVLINLAWPAHVIG